MDYFTIDGVENKYNTYTDIPFYLNLSQLDPSIKNIYAKILLTSYDESISPDNEIYLCDNTNIMVFMEYIDIEKNIRKNVYDDEYKQLIKNFMYRYPFLIFSSENKSVKIVPGYLEQTNQKFSSVKIKMAIEYGDIFLNEADTTNLILKILNSTNGIKTYLINFKKQGCFSNKSTNYKMGQCLICNFYISLFPEKSIYTIRNENNTFNIQSDFYKLYNVYSLQIHDKLKEIMFNLQREIGKPIKIFINHPFYNLKKIYSQLTDTEYLKNDII